MKDIQRLSWFGDGIHPAPSGKWVLFADHEREIKTATALLDRFVELYGEVPLEGTMIGTGLKLWRDFYEWTGDHMILTDDGWEPGEAKEIYEQMAADEELPISTLIHDEVNAPKK